MKKRIMFPMRRYALVLAVAALALMKTAMAQAPPATQPTDKGMQILTDSTLFPESVSGMFLSFVESFNGDLGFGLFGTDVPTAQAPLLSAVEAKYGQANRTEERQGSDAPGPPFDARVYWYGDFGFSVPGPSYGDAAAANRVTYVLWDRKKP